jgi:hypothetical protein
VANSWGQAGLPVAGDVVADDDPWPTRATPARRVVAAGVGGSAADRWRVADAGLFLLAVLAMEPVPGVAALAAATRPPGSRPWDFAWAEGLSVALFVVLGALTRPWAMRRLLRRGQRASGVVVAARGWSVVWGVLVFRYSARVQVVTPDGRVRLTRRLPLLREVAVGDPLEVVYRRYLTFAEPVVSPRDAARRALVVVLASFPFSLAWSALVAVLVLTGR